MAVNDVGRARISMMVQSMSSNSRPDTLVQDCTPHLTAFSCNARRVHTVGVEHFQTITHCSVDVARRLALLFGLGTRALPSASTKLPQVASTHSIRRPVISSSILFLGRAASNRQRLRVSCGFGSASTSTLHSNPSMWSLRLRAIARDRGLRRVWQFGFGGATDCPFSQGKQIGRGLYATRFIRAK